MLATTVANTMRAIRGLTSWETSAAIAVAVTVTSRVSEPPFRGASAAWIGPEAGAGANAAPLKSDA
jgi:hypothetical protein